MSGCLCRSRAYFPHQLTFSHLHNQTQNTASGAVAAKGMVSPVIATIKPVAAATRTNPTKNRHMNQSSLIAGSIRAARNNPVAVHSRPAAGLQQRTAQRAQAE